MTSSHLLNRLRSILDRLRSILDRLILPFLPSSPAWHSPLGVGVKRKNRFPRKRLIELPTIHVEFVLLETKRTNYRIMLRRRWLDNTDRMTSRAGSQELSLIYVLMLFGGAGRGGWVCGGGNVAEGHLLHAVELQAALAALPNGSAARTAQTTKQRLCVITPIPTTGTCGGRTTKSASIICR